MADPARHLNRRRALGMLLGALAGVDPAHSAGAWPAHPIKLVVPLTAGGPTDLLARLLAEPLGAKLGQTLVIDNRPGAGGNIGADFVAKSDPDGYTLFLGTSGPLAINQSLYVNLRYDPARDFAPVFVAATAAFVLLLNPKVPARTVDELLAYARKNPGQLNYGAVPGSAAHLATELFKSTTRINIVQVPYKGAAPATNDLIAGQLDMSFASTPGVMPQVKAGRLRALAVTSPQRLATLADIPTLAESGLPGFEASVWYGVVAPKKTPEEIVRRLNADLVDILRDPKVHELMVRNDFVPMGSTPEQFGAFIRSESTKWSAVVKASGARVG
jgi:tripartite-type tricarboxylate transporter receptor subunit TctC